MHSTTKPMLLGAHISIAGGYYKAIERGESIGCTAIQIFTKSNKSWFAKPIKEEEALLFQKAVHASTIKSIVVHSGYLINLASSSESTRKLSFKSLKEELIRCETLKIPFLILHPGAHTGGGIEKGTDHIIEALNELFKEHKGATSIVLETMAGQGTSIGHTFENLRTIYDTCKYKKRLGICIDTCHLFAAGYDLSSSEGYHSVLKEFSQYFEYDDLKAIHLNDSKEGRGDKKDRHANIGKGKIPLSVFKALIHDPHLKHVPKILETPVKSYLEYEKELELLKGL